LPGFRPDLIVQKDDQVTVIEVKARSSLAANPKIRELSQIIHSKPGWSFELLLVSEPEKLDPPKGAQPFKEENILKRVDEAERALESGLTEAAFLLAWSACEAAIRSMVAAQGVSNDSITTPGYVLNQAVSHGVISRDDYRNLTDMLRYRNAIVHGFALDDFSDELITDLIETVRRMTNTTTGPANFS
jgi:uncharacterized protein YutE (UPF0331/DUF86 family)